jgi:hypothetical protein
MDTFVSVALGLALAAACGFRIFVPFLAASVAAHAGYLPLSSGFEWLGSTPALVAFASATVLEVLAYFVPWLDHALDAIATPAAVAAGIVASASVITDVPPLFKWTVALIGGGGLAGMVQGATVLTRIKSAALTGGIANPLVAAGELFGSVFTSVLGILLPVLTLLVMMALCFLVFFTSKRFLFGKHGGAAGAH